MFTSGILQQQKNDVGNRFDFNDNNFSNLIMIFNLHAHCSSFDTWRNDYYPKSMLMWSQRHNFNDEWAGRRFFCDSSLCHVKS